MLFVDAAHQRGGGRKHLVDEDKDRFLRRQLDALANHVHKLADGEICGHQVFLLVDGGDVGFLDLFTNDLVMIIIVRLSDSELEQELGARSAICHQKTHRNTVGIFLTNTFGLCLALLEGMLVLELGSHGGKICRLFCVAAVVSRESERASDR